MRRMFLTDLPPTPQQIGDANASIPTVQPVIGRPMWGAYPDVAALNSLLFVSELSISTGELSLLDHLPNDSSLTDRLAFEGTIASYGLKKKAVPVKNCRNIGKKDMKNNSYKPKITVDPESYRVSSSLYFLPPASRLLAQLSAEPFAFRDLPSRESSK